MWNIVNSFTMSHSTSPLLGMNAAQKRSFSFNLANVAIAPGKCFQNPNFVNKNNPFVHNFQNKCPFQRVCQQDNSVEGNLKDSIVNSSQSITDIVKEKHLDVIQAQTPEPKPNIQIKIGMCCNNKGRNSKSRRNRRRKKQLKNSKQQNSLREIKEFVDDTEAETSLNTPDLVKTVMPEPLCIKDFLIEPSNSFSEDSDQVHIFDCVTMACSSPIKNRERLLSMTESEDNFIVFESSTDDECDFLEESQSTDEEESEVESIVEDLDSSSSVIPTKRVRFADDLCEIHPMVQWSFAYQQARKGPWEEYARDRDRFKRRIEDTERALKPILDTHLRERIFMERFQNSEVC